jgi:hypothetical protein
LNTGSAILTTSALTAIDHAVTVTYNGDAEFLTSTSGPLNQAVSPASTTTALSSAPNPSIFGEPVTFTATVEVVAPGAGVPMGTVTFSDDSTTLGTAALTGGSASLSIATLGLGGRTITAVYDGGTNFAWSSSPALVQTVEQAATATTVSSDLNPSLLGQPVTLTATVSSAAGTPTGTVTFKDGTRILGDATLSGGAASLTTAGIVAGNRPVTAEYPGDASFAASTSSAWIQSVIYNFEGFFEPLTPAGTDTDPSFSGNDNLGSAVPIKWRISDFDGTFITKRRTIASLRAGFNPDCSGPAEGPEWQLFSPISGTTGGSTLRFDRGNGRFDFNWDTSIVQDNGPGCYSIILEVDDESAPKITIVNLQ